MVFVAMSITIMMNINYTWIRDKAEKKSMVKINFYFISSKIQKYKKKRFRFINKT